MLKDILSKGTQEVRIERKMLIENKNQDDIELFIKLHPAGFDEIFQERQINNIYFDTIDLKNFFDNVNGVSNRLKVRVRWYGPTLINVNSPVLELKYKQNFQVKKIQFSLKKFNLDQNFSLKLMERVFLESSLPGKMLVYLRALKAPVLNRYKRRYFLSKDKRFRLTMDRDMLICRMSDYHNTYLNHLRDDQTRIIELKYPPENDQYAHEIVNHFPYRITKSSKYVQGIEAIYF